LGQDLLGRPAYVKTGLGGPAVEKDVPLGQFGPDQFRINGSQPHLGGIAFGHHLQHCHVGPQS
jgi:hypothetical protein